MGPLVITPILVGDSKDCMKTVSFASIVNWSRHRCFPFALIHDRDNMLLLCITVRVFTVYGGGKRRNEKMIISHWYPVYSVIERNKQQGAAIKMTRAAWKTRARQAG
jgi:hypothetical protein